jgi:mRNA interferase MazF
MKNYFKFQSVLVQYPFTGSSSYKIRPAIILNEKQPDSNDYFIVPITSKTSNLKTGEFILHDYKEAGLNVISAIKRGIFTINGSLIMKKLNTLAKEDQKTLESSLKYWLQID